MAQGYSQVFMRYFTQLVKCLPMDDPLFIAELSTANLLPGNMQPTIQSLTTKVDKSSYFLNNVIKPALDSNFTDSFDNLLNIMEKCEFSFVKQLAISIKADITPTNGHGTGTHFQIVKYTIIHIVIHMIFKNLPIKIYGQLFSTRQANSLKNLEKLCNYGKTPVYMLGHYVPLQ